LVVNGTGVRARRNSASIGPLSLTYSAVKSVKPYAPEASSGGRLWAEMTKGFHLDLSSFSSVQFSYFVNNRQPNGSLSNVLSRLAVGVRVDGDGETQRKEHEREGDQEETRHRVLACVPSEYS
jgi:hypothetical protein